TPAFARAGSLSRGSGPTSYPAKPLVSFRTYRQLSGWNPPPLMIRAFRAHCQDLTFTGSPANRCNRHRAVFWRLTLPPLETRAAATFDRDQLDRGNRFFGTFGQM